jgi:hypothetical protein
MWGTSFNMELDSLQNSGDFTDNSAVHTDRMDNTTKLQDLAPRDEKELCYGCMPK